jgi:hypothetical protein
MTVNTLGSHELRPPRTVGEWLWPFIPMGISACSLSALIYYHLRQDVFTAQSPLQQFYAWLYRTVGLAPAVLFFLLVLTWSTIWLVTGRLERPIGRLCRLAAMAVLLGVFLNLGDGGVAPAVHKGTLGAWFAETLVAAFTYMPALVLVFIATLASLLLATDFFFHERFEQLRVAGPATESGVETAVTDHLRALAEADATPGGAVATPSAGSGRMPFAAFAPAADVPDVAAVDATAAEPPAAPGRRRSYFERRLERQAAPPRETSLQEEIDRAAAAAQFEETPAEETEELPIEELPIEERAFGERRFDEAPAEAAATQAGPVAAHDARDLAPSMAPADIVDVEELGDIDDDSDEPAEAEADEPLSTRASRDERVAPDAAAEPDARAAEPRAEAPEGEDAFVIEDETELDAAVVETAREADADAGEAAADEDDTDEDDTDEDDTDEAESGEELAVVESKEANERIALLPPAPTDEELAATAEHDADVAEDARAAAAREDVSPDEPLVAIPRPDPAAVPPAAAAETPARQQKLFGDGLDEELVQEAVEVVVGARRASVSLLQRKLRIDYALASELLAELAARGVVALEGDATQGRVLG